MSYRRAVEHLQQRYMLDLTQAPFAIADAKLLAAAGSCAKCPKRTGNQPVVFADIKSADVCTDPDCYGEKRAAHHARVIVEANKKGIPVLEGDEAAVALRSTWNSGSDLVKADASLWHFARNAPQTKNNGTIAEHLADGMMPLPSKYVKNERGEAIALYGRADIQKALEKVGACETVEAHAARMAEPKNQTASEAKRQEADAEHAAAVKRAEDEENYRVELYKRLRAKGHAGFTLQSLRELTKLALDTMPLPDDLLGEIYGFDTSSDESVKAHIGSAGLPELQLILMDLIVGETLSCNYWDVKNSNGEVPAFNAVVEMAKAEGIDPDQVREELFPSPIDAASMTAADLVAFIARYPGRINELVTPIIEHAPHLVKTLDEAAKTAGFKYENSRFVRDDESAEAVDHAPDSAALAESEQLPEEAPCINLAPVVSAVEQPVEQIAEPKSKPRKQKPTGPVTVDPWPFPKSRDEALAKSSAGSSDGVPAAVESPAAEPAAA